MQLEINENMIDRIMVEELTRIKKSFERDLEQDEPNMYIYGDPKADKKKIRKMIKAVKMVREYYR